MAEAKECLCDPACITPLPLKNVQAVSWSGKLHGPVSEDEYLKKPARLGPEAAATATATAVASEKTQEKAKAKEKEKDATPPPLTDAMLKAAILRAYRFYRAYYTFHSETHSLSLSGAECQCAKDQPSAGQAMRAYFTSAVEMFLRAVLRGELVVHREQFLEPLLLLFIHWVVVVLDDRACWPDISPRRHPRNKKPAKRPKLLRAIAHWAGHAISTATLLLAQQLVAVDYACAVRVPRLAACKEFWNDESDRIDDFCPVVEGAPPQRAPVFRDDRFALLRRLALTASDDALNAVLAQGGDSPAAKRVRLCDGTWRWAV